MKDDERRNEKRRNFGIGGILIMNDFEFLKITRKIGNEGRREGGSGREMEMTEMKNRKSNFSIAIFSVYRKISTKRIPSSMMWRFSKCIFACRDRRDILMAEPNPENGTVAQIAGIVSN